MKFRFDRALHRSGPKNASAEYDQFEQEHPEGIDTRTEKQKEGLIRILRRLRARYPSAKIMGHRDISEDKNHNGKIDPWERIKNCPCFDAIPEYSFI